MSRRNSAALALAASDAETAWQRTSDREDYELMADAIRRSQSIVGHEGLIAHLQRRAHAVREAGDRVLWERYTLAWCDELERSFETMAKAAKADMLSR